ncbi:MAG TPA: DinB family protein [Candidatus Acidoferrum sp.]|nr:DinB family protein [Candidatus Acidoferrum sp.]
MSPATGLPPQLDDYAEAFLHATVGARNLLLYTNEDLLKKRPSAADWSALECLVHLNLSTAAMLPGMRQAIDAAPPAQATHRYRMDLPGRLLAWSLEPPAILKTKASEIAQPRGNADPTSVLEEFEWLHAQLGELLVASAGKKIDSQKLKSPFANAHYNAFSAFAIIAAHDRRHLWQARKAVQR